MSILSWDKAAYLFGHSCKKRTSVGIVPVPPALRILHRSVIFMRWRTDNRLPENFLSFAGHLEFFAGHLIKFNCSSSPDILKIRRTCPAWPVNFGKPETMANARGAPTCRHNLCYDTLVIKSTHEFIVSQCKLLVYIVSWFFLPLWFSQTLPLNILSEEVCTSKLHISIWGDSFDRNYEPSPSQNVYQGHPNELTCSL